MKLFKVRTDETWTIFPNPWWVLANSREESMDKVRKMMQDIYPTATMDGYAVLMAGDHEVIV